MSTVVEKSIDSLIRQVDEIRLELIRLRRLVREGEADRTPVRPPSQSAMKAFESSRDFLVKKPK